MYNVFDQEIVALLIFEHDIILVLVTSAQLALDSFLDVLTSIFSVEEVGHEIVAAAFLQRCRKKFDCIHKIISFLPNYHFMHLKCIKTFKYLFVFVFLEILDLEDSFERRDEVGVEQVEIDSSRTRFGGSIDFDKYWSNCLFLFLLQ